MTFIAYDLRKIVRADHELRRVEGVVSFKKIAKKYKEIEGTVGRRGYSLEVGIKCLFLQFWYDLSDRDLEEQMRDSMSMRLFCGMSIDEETPDHTFFCRIRSKLGTKRIGQVFKNIRQKSEEAGLLRKVFRFADSSNIVSKETTWAERDKALEDGEEVLNNHNVQRYSADAEARFGCKGKDKFWYGYKRHLLVDMGSGLIDKVCVTPANVPDQLGLERLRPKGCMVFADKAYCLKDAQEALKRGGCHDGTIKKRNMISKDKDKDSWISKVRGPFESVFSRQSKRTRYRGTAKVQMQAFLEAMVFNVKRLLTIHAPPLYVGA